MQRRPGDLPPRQLPYRTFPWKAAQHHVGMWSETTQEKEKNILEVLGGLTLQPLSKRNSTQHEVFFSLGHSSLEMIFPNRLGLEFYFSFCSQCKFYSQLHYLPEGLFWWPWGTPAPVVRIKQGFRISWDAQLCCYWWEDGPVEEAFWDEPNSQRVSSCRS